MQTSVLSIVFISAPPVSPPDCANPVQSDGYRSGMRGGFQPGACRRFRRVMVVVDCRPSRRSGGVSFRPGGASMKSGASVRSGAGILFACALSASPSVADERGEYLAMIMDCGGCHTPGYLKGEPDMSRYLGGSDI